MGTLRRILRDLRAEAERLRGVAGPGPGEIDPERLTDDELARLDVLLTRLCREQDQDAGRHHVPGADDRRKGHACGCPVCTTPEGERPPALSGDDLRELARLLDRARRPAA